MTQGALADAFKRFPMVGATLKTLMAGTIRRLVADTKLNEQHSLDLIEKRVVRHSDRKDFMTRILEHREKDEVSNVQLAAHAADFVTAGSETTATALACICYYLMKTPAVAKKLRAEIDGAFSQYQDITAASTTPLPYLNAVIQEGMRLYPPLPIALPRIVPSDATSATVPRP